MKNIRKIFESSIIYILIIFSVSCGDKGNHEIKIINNADYVIWCDYSFYYPNVYYPFVDKHIKEIQPHSSGILFSKVYSGLGRSWERHFAQDILSDTLMICISDSSVIVSSPYNTDYSVIQRYDVSLQDLVDLNWTLYYPPTEVMKNIKMYPPYNCKNCSHFAINIVNNTDDINWWSYSFYYPNTDIYTPVIDISKGILPHSSDKLFTEIDNGGKDWEKHFAQDILSDTLIIFVSDEWIYNPEHSVIQRYYVTLQNLIDINWTLYYPPTEAMKDIKMYPLYNAE